VRGSTAADSAAGAHTRQGCIKPLCDLLTCQDARIVTVALEGLENILRVGEADKELGGASATNQVRRLGGA
jgi:importin subunit alpha-1